VSSTPLDPLKAIRVESLRIDAPRLAPHLPTDTRQSDPDLGLVIERWEALPGPIKAGILAMVKAATPKGGEGGIGDGGTLNMERACPPGTT
jgi:hypothetical protein